MRIIIEAGKVWAKSETFRISTQQQAAGLALEYSVDKSACKLVGIYTCFYIYIYICIYIVT